MFLQCVTYARGFNDILTSAESFNAKLKFVETLITREQIKGFIEKYINTKFIGCHSNSRQFLDGDKSSKGNDLAEFVEHTPPKKCLQPDSSYSDSKLDSDSRQFLHGNKGNEVITLKQLTRYIAQ